MILEKKWAGPRITFGLSLCPICKVSVLPPLCQGDSREEMGGTQDNIWFLIVSYI